MSVEQRILDVVNANVSAWRDSRELRAIALEVRKREDRIKQLEDRIKRLEEARTVEAANSLATMMSYVDAIAKIKRLEEAGDEMANAYEEICHDSYDQKQIANWRKAKEAKL